MTSRLRSEQYKSRSSRSRMFFKISVDKNFANFTGKHLCWGLFIIKLQALKADNFIKSGLQHKWLFVEFAKFLRTPSWAASAKP